MNLATSNYSFRDPLTNKGHRLAMGAARDYDLALVTDQARASAAMCARAAFS